MQIVRFNTLEELQPYAQAWDRLAASVPFRSWTWLSTWWRHYGGDANALRPKRELFVLAVFDDGDTLVGLAPWFIQSTAAFGSVVRMLGSGEVCSDYLTLLSRHGLEEDVAEIVAEYLTDSLPDDSRGSSRLGPNRTYRRGLRRPSDGLSRRIAAPPRLHDSSAKHDQLLADRSADRLGRLSCRAVEEIPPGSAAAGTQVFRLRQGRAARASRNWAICRRASICSSICISGGGNRSASRAATLRRNSTNFIREVSPLLMQQGQMQIQWLEIDGRPAAVEYQLLGGGVVYAYQTGIEPEAVEHQPGKLTNLASIRRAIEGGHRGYDFLRGDEPYKAHFRATPRPSMEIRIIPDRPAAQLRHKLWLTGSNVKRWLKNGLKTAGKMTKPMGLSHCGKRSKTNPSNLIAKT